MDDLGNRAEDASIAASAGAQQLPVKLEGRSREVEHELNRTVQVTNIISRLKIRIKVNNFEFSFYLVSNMKPFGFYLFLDDC